MQESVKGMETSGPRGLKGARSPSPSTWSALAVLALAMAAGGITARLEAGPRYDWLLLMTAMGLTGAVAMRLLADNAAEREAAGRYPGDPLRDLLDSAGPIMVSIDLDGLLTFVNTAGERLLGYHAAELVNRQRMTDLLAAGEAPHLLAELQRLCGIEASPDPAASHREAFADVVRTMPPSLMPSLETHLRRKDGSLFSGSTASFSTAQPGWRANRAGCGGAGPKRDDAQGTVEARIEGTLPRRI